MELPAAATNKPPHMERLKQKLIEFPLEEVQGCLAGGPLSLDDSKTWSPFTL